MKKTHVLIALLTISFLVWASFQPITNYAQTWTEEGGAGTHTPSAYEVYVDSYDTFALAVAACGSYTRTLIVTQGEAVDEDVTVPETLTIKVLRGGEITPSSGFTVTMNYGHLDAGPYQIFGGDGTITLVGSRFGKVYPQWWGVLGDGSTDNYTNLAKAALASDYLCFPNGTYIVGTTVKMDDGDTWEAENPRGATIKLKNSADCHLIENSDTTSGNTGLCLKGLIIDGNGTNQTDPVSPAQVSSAVRWENVDNSRIENCEIKNGGDACIRLSGDTDTGTKSSYNIITGNYIHNSDYYSLLWIRNAEYNTVSNNILKDGGNGKDNDDCQGNGIALFTNSSYNAITGNIIDTVSKCGIGVGGQSALGWCYNNTISNNVIRNCQESGIDLHDGANNSTVTSNQCYGNKHGISLIESSYCTVSANLSYSNTENGIYLAVEEEGYYCKHNVIIGNIVRSNGKNGIYLGTSTCNMISENQILDNSTTSAGTYYGILLFGASEYNQIINNIIYDTATLGAGTTQRVPIREGSSLAGNNRILNNSAGFMTAKPYLNSPVVASAGTISIKQGSRLSRISGTADIYAVTPPAGMAAGEEVVLFMQSTATLKDPIAAVDILALSSSGIVATADTDGPHSLATGDGIVIASTDNWQYAGYFTVTTVPSSDRFTYNFPGCATTPDPDWANPTVQNGNLRLSGAWAGGSGTFVKLVWDGIYFDEVATSVTGL